MAAAASHVLAGAIAASQPVAAGMRTGIVSAIGVVLPNGQAGITVNISGSQMNLPYQTSYAPVPGDIVNVTKTANAWLVMGTAGSNSEVNGVRGYLDMAVMGVSTLGPTSGTTELELTNLDLTSLNLYVGRTYMIHLQGFFSQTVATDRFVIMAHQGPFTNPSVTNANFTTVTTGDSKYFSWPYTPSQTLFSTNMRFGVARNTGTGTLSLSGSPGSGVVRTWSAIEDVTMSSIVRIV